MTLREEIDDLKKDCAFLMTELANALGESRMHSRKYYECQSKLDACEFDYDRLRMELKKCQDKLDEYQRRER